MTNLHATDRRKYKVVELCKLLGDTKQAYYKRDDNKLMDKAAQEAFAVNFVKEVREKDPGIGGVKLWLMYQKEFKDHNPMGRDRFEDMIDRYNLKVRKRIRKPRTTDSTHGLPVYPNLIKDFIPTAPNQVWVSDITYIAIHFKNGTYRWCYLSLILDAYTEEIIGWSVGPTLETTYPLEALQMALKRIEGKSPEEVNLIHHSDRGVQYASSAYVSTLKQHGITISMTESGDPKDNAKAERVNNTMKNELLKGMVFTSMEEVIEAVRNAVKFYNEERPHMSLDMMTPAEAANFTGIFKKRWTSYREKHIMEQHPELNLYPAVYMQQSGVNQLRG